MANYQLLKADIDAKVYENAYREITGENLNSVLNAMVTTLGAEYQFAGVATIDTNPGNPDAKVFYIAKGKGTYTNFGGLQVTEDEVVVLYYDTEWHKVATGIASNEKLTELESKTDTEITKLLSKSDFQTYKNQVNNNITTLEGVDDRIKLLLGFNASRSVVNLELGVSGKYVKCETRSAVANAAFAISKPFAVDACSELLIKTGFNPSDAAHSGLDLTVIAIYEEIERQRTVQKKDGSGNPLYYVVVVDPETGAESPTSDETTVNTGYPVYVQETYTETRYLPNNEDRFVAIPDSEYYVANIPQSCNVVVSYKPGVSDTAVIIEKHGALANLISQVFGIYEHRTMVEAMVSLAARVDALESKRGLIGNAKAGTLDVTELTKCLYPTILRGHGVPAASNIPDNLPEGLPWDGVPVFVGQLYINLDATSSGLYYSTGHDSVSDWKQA